ACFVGRIDVHAGQLHVRVLDDVAQGTGPNVARRPLDDPVRRRHVGPASQDFDMAMARSARARKPASFSSGVRTRVLRDMTDTSWPSACLRRAPTVASSFFTCVKGSNEYQRMAFSWVILLIWSSGTLFSANTRPSSSGAPG